MEEQKDFRMKRINYLRALIGKLQLSDNANPVVYDTAVSQLAELYEVGL